MTHFMFKAHWQGLPHREAMAQLELFGTRSCRSSSADRDDPLEKATPVYGFELTAEQRQLRGVARDVAIEIYRPLNVGWDRDRVALPDMEVKRLADLGFLGLALPEEYGGSGGTLLDALLVVEELAKESRSAAFQVFEANVGPSRVIELFGTAEQRASILPKVVTGEVTMAIGISEPDAGSAATDMRTSARRMGDEWVINGSKRWISNEGRLALPALLPPLR